MPEIRVGLIGTGIMGGHMARRLVQAGFPVTAWNRTPAKAGATSAKVAVSPRAVLAASDVVIVMLSDETATEAVLFSDDRAVFAMQPGAVLVMMSSIPVAACRSQFDRLRTACIGYVDAPVSGGEAGARDGKLAILGGGDAADIVRIAPVMAPLGRLTHLGPVGSGQLAKLANQIIVGGAMVAVAEALHFAQAGGANPAALQQALQGGFGDSTVLRQHGLRMVHGDFVPGSPAMYQLKDMRTALSLANGMGVRPALLPLLVSLFESLEQAGEGTLDVSAIFREVARRSTAAVQS